VTAPGSEVPDFDASDLGRLRQRRSAKWAKYPSDVLPAFVAEMDFDVAPAIRDALVACATTADLGYPYESAPDRLADLLATRMHDRYGWSVDAGLVARMPDVVFGLDRTVHAFSDPGEAVVVQPPVYPPFLGAVLEQGRVLAENPVVADARGRYGFDLDGLRAHLAGGSRLILLCHPHNPTGRVFDRDELTAIGDLACEFDAVVVSDEVHAELTLPGAEFVPLASISPEVAARTVTLTAASKAFNLAGAKCAFAVFGSAALLERYRRRVNDLHTHTGTFGMAATRAAWLHGSAWHDALVAHLDRMRAHLGELLAGQLPAVRWSPPEATYLAWLDCRGLGLPEPPSHWFLYHAKVALEEGTRFGAGGDGFVRLNFATSTAILDQIVGRLAHSLSRV